ncbi:MAG: response regulator, partial [Deltaproteobacteria bacterium]|nr:response regulator [Deltaproteobacteria bacterium]
IVDDNTTLAYFTARNLSRDIPGLAVVTVGCCEEALAAAEKHVPSVVIADFKLTDGNGIDLCRKIARQIPDVATILISGETPPEPLRRDLFAFLLKPYEAETLVSIVNQALARDTNPAQRPQTRSWASCEGYDRHKLCNLLGQLVVGMRAFGKELLDHADDPEAIRRVVEQYVDVLCSTAMKLSYDLPECPPGHTVGKRGQEKCTLAAK